MEIPSHPSRMVMMSTFYIFFEVLLRRLSRYFHDRMPSGIVTAGLSILFGIFFYYAEPYGEDYQGITNVPVQDILFCYMSIYIICTMYTMDMFLYNKTLSAVCIICGSVLLISVTGVAIMQYFVNHPEWEWTEAWLAALVVMPIQPTYATGLLRELSKYRNVATILDVESVATYMAISIAFEYIRSIQNGHVKEIFAHIHFLLWYIIGGCILGALTGKLTALSVGPVYNESRSAIGFVLGITLLTHFGGEYLLAVSGNAAVVIMASYLIEARHKFSNEVDKNIKCFLQVLQTFVEVSALCLYVAEALPHLIGYFTESAIASSMILYATLTLMRVAIFLLFGFCMNTPVMNLDYDSRTALILGLSGIKGSINLMMAFMLLLDPVTFAVGRAVVTETLLLYVYSIAANAIPLRVVLQIIGFVDPSTSRRQNMNACLKHIMNARLTMIDSLKSQYIFGDANWQQIRLDTQIRHPYNNVFINEANTEDSGESDEVFHISAAICPDCFHHVPYELTEKDIRDLCEESRVKLLKAKKISVNRQFESGAINVNCLQLLLYNIDLLLDEKIVHAKLDIPSYLKTPAFFAKIQDCFLRCRDRKPIPPKHNWRRYIFYLVHHRAYDYMVLIVVIIYCVYSLCYLLSPMTSYSASWYSGLIVLFAVDFLFRTIVLNHCKDFARSKWLLWSLFWIIIETFLLYQSTNTTEETKLYFSICCRITPIMRLSYLYIARNTLSPMIVDALDHQIDAKISFGFDVAAALVFCCDEILDVLPQLLDMRLIRDLYNRDLRTERSYLLGEMRRVQKERPSIAITMKTKQVIRSTLNAMNEGLFELKNTGYIDSIEFDYINLRIVEKLKMLRSMRFVPPSTPKIIFDEIPWLCGNLEMIDYLYKKVDVVHIEPGETVMKELHKAIGVYVVISGTLKLYYRSDFIKHRELVERGNVPIVDYLSTVNFAKDVEDDILSGSTFGERSVLTRRRYNCSIVADSPVEAYLLTTDVLHEAFSVYNNPVTGLEAKMWKYSTISLAIAIMSSSKAYKTLNRKEIKSKLDRSFVPSLRCYKLFVVTDAMDDLLLIEGTAMDCHSKEVFHAPMLIPKNTHKMYVSKSEKIEHEFRKDTKLMIVPSPGKTEEQIMMREEILADIVSYTTSKCVLHNAQEMFLRKPLDVDEPSHVVTPPTQYVDVQGVCRVEINPKFEE